MSWNPNQGQDPNQPGQYGGYAPPAQPQPTDPYSQPQPGYGQQPGGYQQPGSGRQPGGYQQPVWPAARWVSATRWVSAARWISAGTIWNSSNGAQSPLGPTSMGMQPNIEAGLSYVLGWVTGLIFFLMEKQNRFVRFHAMQSILFFGGLTVIQIILSFISFFDIPFLGLLVGLVSIAVGIIGLVGYIILLINGFQGKYLQVAHRWRLR